MNVGCLGNGVQPNLLSERTSKRLRLLSAHHF